MRIITGPALRLLALSATVLGVAAAAAVDGLDRALDGAPAGTSAPAAAPGHGEPETPLRLSPDLSLPAEAAPTPEPPAPPPAPAQPRNWLLISLFAALFLLLANRLWQWWLVVRSRRNDDAPDWSMLRQANWPGATVLLQTPDEDEPLSPALDALLNADYPADALRVRVCGTLGEVQRDELASYLARLPHRVMPASASLAEGVRESNSEILLFARADWQIGREFVRRATAPCLDPAVGAVLACAQASTPDTPLAAMRLLCRDTYAMRIAPRLQAQRLPAIRQSWLVAARRHALANSGGWQNSDPAQPASLAWRLLAEGWLTQHLAQADFIAQTTRRSGGALALLARLPMLLASRQLGWRHKLFVLAALGDGASRLFGALCVLLAMLAYVQGHALLASLVLLLTALGAPGGLSLTVVAATALSSERREQLYLLPVLLMPQGEAHEPH